MDMRRRDDSVRCMECMKSNMETYITTCKTDSQWEFAI